MKPKKSTQQAPPLEITAEERYHLINDAAYFRSLQRQKEAARPADQAGSWCEAEAQIDEVLKQHHAKP
jgi:hypothetical protein